MTANRDQKIIAKQSLSEYFHEQVQSALTQTKVELQQETAFYLVKLLEAFGSAENLHRQDDKALGEMFLRAVQHEQERRQIERLKHVGDVALYVSGFFSDSLNRKLVDVDYYISIGGNAYANLTSIVKSKLYASLYRELATKFYQLVDVLAFISEQENFTNNKDLLRVYERWLNTGSERLESMLASEGIVVGSKKKSLN